VENHWEAPPRKRRAANVAPPALLRQLTEKQGHREPLESSGMEFEVIVIVDTFETASIL